MYEVVYMAILTHILQARVETNVLARVVTHVLAHVVTHVLACAIMHMHDYYLKTCVPGAYSDQFLKNSDPGNTPKECF